MNMSKYTDKLENLLQANNNFDEECIYAINDHVILVKTYNQNMIRIQLDMITCGRDLKTEN